MRWPPAKPGRTCGRNTLNVMTHHIVITGPGRCGTTLLVELLGACGLDTGFHIQPEANANYYPASRCGLEWNYAASGVMPYVLKSPGYCDQWASIFFDPMWTIDQVYIPMRDITAAAESRRAVAKVLGVPTASHIPPGGLDGTASLEPGIQEWILLEKTYRLLLNLSHTDIPVTLLKFPRLAYDPEYLYRKIQGSLQGMAFIPFQQHFNAVVRPDHIHQFSDADL